MPNARSRLGIPALVLLLAATAACDGAQFAVNYAPGFSPAAARSSVAFLGVFREGRLNAEGWAVLGPPLSAPLGQPLCDAAFTDRLQNVNPELYGRVDEDVRSNGVTDELLTQLSSRTDGDLLVTLSVLGRVELAHAPMGSADPIPTTGGRAPMGGGRTRGHNRGSNSGRHIEFSGLELSASMFSVKQHQSVGRLTMRYSGTSLEEALKLFAVRLGTELPGATCRPWKWGEPPPPPL